MGERCPGSDAYVGVHDEKAVDRAPCPQCGRLTSFHRITGRFARHNAPSGETEGEG